MMPVADRRGNSHIAMGALFDLRSALGVLSNEAYLALLDIEREMFILRLEALFITLQRYGEEDARAHQ